MVRSCPRRQMHRERSKGKIRTTNPGQGGSEKTKKVPHSVGCLIHPQISHASLPRHRPLPILPPPQNCTFRYTAVLNAPPQQHHQPHQCAPSYTEVYIAFLSVKTYHEEKKRKKTGRNAGTHPAGNMTGRNHQHSPASSFQRVHRLYISYSSIILQNTVWRCRGITPIYHSGVVLLTSKQKSTAEQVRLIIRERGRGNRETYTHPTPKRKHKKHQAPTSTKKWMGKFYVRPLHQPLTAEMALLHATHLPFGLL